MSVHGIPTQYRNIQFRSRNEARWAAMFDLIGWQWEYEPLDAHGYIPDFAILGPHPLLVEVKSDLSVNALNAYVERIGNSLRGVWTADVLIVGGTPLPYDDSIDGRFWEQPVAGLLGEYQSYIDPNRPDWWFEVALWNRCGHPKCGELAVIHCLQSYACRPCGHYDGDGFLRWDDRYERAIRSGWAKASNGTQWQPTT